MQGEEGPPSLEYIQAKDLFPPKELIKEEESLQVRKQKHPNSSGMWQAGLCRAALQPSTSWRPWAGRCQGHIWNSRSLCMGARPAVPKALSLPAQPRQDVSGIASRCQGGRS